MFSKDLGDNKVIPVLTIESIEQGLELTQALVDGGITVAEVTLRTEAAVSVIKELKNSFPNVLVLAGTVVNEQNMKDVAEAGADGVISPAFSKTLVESARKHDVKFMPGVATPSEVLAGMEMGLTEFKLFPAAAVGGAALLKSLAGPLPQVSFCPTGGLNYDNFTDYLALPNVNVIGGSWMVPKSAIDNKDWAEITRLSKEAVDKAAS